MCHPALQLKWFKKLGEIEYQRAKTLFQHVFEEYKKSNRSNVPEEPPREATQTPTSAQSSTSFLQSIGSVPTWVDNPDDEQNNDPEETEFECYAIRNEHREDDFTKCPLIWWKVRALLSPSSSSRLNSSSPEEKQCVLHCYQGYCKRPLGNSGIKCFCRAPLLESAAHLL